MEVSKSKICREDQQACDPGKSQWCSSSPKAIYRQNFLFSRGDSLLSVFSWWDEAYPHYGGSSALLKIYWFKYYSHLKIDQLSGFHGLANLTHKSNHHSPNFLQKESQLGKFLGHQYSIFSEVLFRSAPGEDIKGRGTQRTKPRAVPNNEMRKRPSDLNLGLIREYSPPSMQGSLATSAKWDFKTAVDQWLICASHSSPFYRGVFTISILSSFYYIILNMCVEGRNQCVLLLKRSEEELHPALR